MTWLNDLDAASKSDELLALRRARHRALAHTATPNLPYQGKARPVVCGDERKLLEATIPIVERAGSFLGYSYETTFDDQRRMRREDARRLWGDVARTE